MVPFVGTVWFDVSKAEVSAVRINPVDISAIIAAVIFRVVICFIPL
jgi:hypothetical protein